MSAFRKSCVALLYFVPALIASDIAPSPAAVIPAPASSVSGSASVLRTGSVMVGDSSVITVTGSGAQAGVEEQVWKTTAGTYDFLFQVTNLSSSSTALNIDVANFTGVASSVAYLHSAGITASGASRSAAGDVLKFSFANTGNAALLPGAKSDWLAINTEAQIFSRTGTMGTISGNTLQLNGVYVPALSAPQAIPEPSTYGLAVAGALSLLGIMRYRKARRN